MNEALRSGGIVSSLCGDRDYLISLAKKPGHYCVSVYSNGIIKLKCIKEDKDHYVFSTTTNMMGFNFVSEKDVTDWGELICKDRYLGYYALDFLDGNKMRIVGNNNCAIAADGSKDNNFVTLVKNDRSSLHDTRTGDIMDCYDWFVKLTDTIVSSWIHTPKFQSCKWRISDTHYHYWYQLDLQLFNHFARYMAIEFFRIPLPKVEWFAGNICGLSIELGCEEFKVSEFNKNVINLNQISYNSIVLQLKFNTTFKQRLFWSKYRNFVWELDAANSVSVSRLLNINCLLLRLER